MTDLAATMALLEPFVKSCESCRLSAYLPTPKDRPTIGWGATFHVNGAPVRMGEVINQAAADAMLEASLRTAMTAVAHACGSAPTTPNELAAMVSLAFNIGEHAFEESTVLRLHRLGDHTGAAAAFVLWDRQGDVVLPGLLNRRRREAAMYLGGKA